jgi:site-specific DNA-methyltransferase (adenine-specific)
MKDIELWHGDCLEEMKKIADKSVDCVICDLPYEVLNKGNKNAQWDKMLPMDKLWGQYNRVIKDKGAIILFGQGMFTAQLMFSNPKMWRYNLIWNKINRPTGFLNANRMPLRVHEDICVFYKKLPEYHPQMTSGNVNHRHGGAGNSKFKSGKNGCYGEFRQTETILTNDKYPLSIINIPKEHSTFYHPTQKPVALIEWLIKTYTNEGDVILDNTAGSMTTAIAAINTKRKCICIEKDDKYFEIGSKRVRKHLENQQLKLF